MSHLDLKTDDVKRAYRRWAPVYDMLFGRLVDAGRRHACAHINTLGGRVLEAGVGTGISLPMYGPEVTVTGVDLSTDMLDRARKRVERQGLGNVEALREMDITALEFPDESFDVVASMYTITAVPEPQKVMAEFERVCRTGGEVVLVSHFESERGFYRHVERTLAPYGRRLGWHPAMPVSHILCRPRLELVEQRRFPPLGLFSMLRLRKLPADGAADA